MAYNFIQKQDSMSFGDILEYVIEDEKITTADEVAIVAGVQKPTVYSWMSDRTEPSYSKSRAVNKMLIEKYGCHIIEDQYHVPEDIHTDGSYLNEMRDLIKEMNEIEEHSENENYQKALDDCYQMRKIIDRYYAETKEKMQ